MGKDRKIICLTPIKNEAWILERFLRCASLWADIIIIADQQSDDGSVEIARSFEKVRLVQNTSIEFNEPERQKLLIDEARKLDVEGEKILIALDADEILSSNVLSSLEWNTLLHAPKGTVFKFKRANLRPGLRDCWFDKHEFVLGVVDYGAEHMGRSIHSERIPYDKFAKSILLNDVRVLHYQYSDWMRMQSKHRWYLVWEKLHNSRKSILDLYRQYHHMYSSELREYYQLREEWFAEYLEAGIDMTSIQSDGWYRWDREVLELFGEHGTEFFKDLPVWDIDWIELAKDLNISTPDRFKDPRGYLTVRFHHWLAETQSRAESTRQKIIDECLKLVGF